MASRLTRGFTLIEVLIAAVILFSSLGLVAELYSQSSLSSNKISNITRISQSHPIAIRAIKTQLRLSAKDKSLSEHRGTVLINGVDYEWFATRTRFEARPADVDELFTPPATFGMYDVEVEVSIDGKFLEILRVNTATW